MCTSLLPEESDGFYSYLVFMSSSIVGQCPINMNILTTKTGILQIGLRKQNYDFLENDPNDFD
jgi:hypothetical protein